MGNDYRGGTAVLGEQQELAEPGSCRFRTAPKGGYVCVTRPHTSHAATAQREWGRGSLAGGRCAAAGARRGGVKEVSAQPSGRRVQLARVYRGTGAPGHKALGRRFLVVRRWSGCRGRGNPARHRDIPDCVHVTRSGSGGGLSRRTWPWYGCLSVIRAQRVKIIIIVE